MAVPEISDLTGSVVFIMGHAKGFRLASKASCHV